MKIQATCIAFNGRAYLIMGESGIGKSSLALSLINSGAFLIADDLVEVTNGIAFAPKEKQGWLEVRGIGLISGIPVLSSAPVVAKIRLVKEKPERIPPHITDEIPEFRIWTEDKDKKEKFLLIDKIMTGSVKIEGE